MSEIKTLTSSLKQVRESVDSYHSGWFQTLSEMCNEVGITPSVPRICGRQRHRASTPASNPSEYFFWCELNRLGSSARRWSKIGIVMVLLCLARSLLGAISHSNGGSLNCIQCDDESGRAICCRPPKLVTHTFIAFGCCNYTYMGVIAKQVYSSSTNCCVYFIFVNLRVGLWLQQ